MTAPSTSTSNTDVFDKLAATIAARRGADETSSYTASLFAKGSDTILKKVGEEATEFVLAAKHASLGGKNSFVVKEAADLIFHLFVALADRGVPLEDVRAELKRREGTSGHAEKAARTEK
jgi:phosphoribosyl-ATP pyrophosphohydrolase